MGNFLVFILVILAGIYAIFVIYRQVKTGKCAGCTERNACSARKTGDCPTKSDKNDEH